MTTILPTYSCMHHFNYFHTLSNFLFEFYGCSSNFNISFNLFILIVKIFYNFNHFLFIVLKLFGVNIILVDEFIQFFLQVRDFHNFEKLIFLNIRAQTAGILNIKYFSGNLTVPVTLDIRLVSRLIESWSFRNKLVLPIIVCTFSLYYFLTVLGIKLFFSAATIGSEIRGRFSADPENFILVLFLFRTSFSSLGLGFVLITLFLSYLSPNLISTVFILGLI